MKGFKKIIYFFPFCFRDFVFPTLYCVLRTAKKTYIIDSRESLCDVIEEATQVENSHVDSVHKGQRSSHGGQPEAESVVSLLGEIRQPVASLQVKRETGECLVQEIGGTDVERY